MVEVQNLWAFFDFCKPRATLCGDSRGRGSKTEDFYDFCKPRVTLCGDRACRSALAVAPCDFVAREMVFGSCLVVCAPAFAIPRSRVRFPTSTRSTFPQLRQHLRRATCAESLAQSNLRRATCTEHLHKALAQSNLHRPTCTEHMRNRRRALAQSNLLRALAGSSLQRATCAQQPGTM